MARRNLMGVGEISRTFHVSMLTARKWSNRDGFPEPIGEVGTRPVWDGLEVVRWEATSRPKPGRPAGS